MTEPASSTAPTARPAVAPRRGARWVIAGLLLAVGAGAAAWGWQLALQRLRSAVEASLGPRASVEAITVGWRGVVVDGLRLRAAPGWPAEDELRAAQVRLRPAWAAVLRGERRIASVEIDGAYASLLRTRDGKLRVVPGLDAPEGRPAGSGGGAEGTAAPAVRIDRLVLNAATLDFHDASVRQPPHRLRLGPVQATLGTIVLPAGDTPMAIALDATLKGPQRDGRLTIAGQLALTGRDATLHARAQGVDLVALQPYLLKAHETGVRRGTLDLTLDATVKGRHLEAPGRVVLTGLELNPGNGLLGGFGGVPRQAVIAAMQRDGRIDVRFTLAGRLDDPAFSLNENLATKIAGGVAESLGVSVGGVVQGVGNVIKGLLGK